MSINFRMVPAGLSLRKINELSHFPSRRTNTNVWWRGRISANSTSFFSLAAKNGKLFIPMNRCLHDTQTHTHTAHQNTPRLMDRPPELLHTHAHRPPTARFICHQTHTLNNAYTHRCVRLPISEPVISWNITRWRFPPPAGGKADIPRPSVCAGQDTWDGSIRGHAGPRSVSPVLLGYGC